MAPFVRIIIVDYDPRWPALYDLEAARIQNILGGRVCRLEHVGSTAVPGLAAKPRIDIVLAVTSSAEESDYVADLEAAGYRLNIREPEWFEHRVFKGPATDINLHVFSDGCEEIGRMLAFRDRLRQSPGDRTLYEQTKRDLAKRKWIATQNYADAKTDIVAEILRRALGETAT